MKKIFWTKEFLDKNLMICSKSPETHFGLILFLNILDKNLIICSKYPETHFGFNIFEI